MTLSYENFLIISRRFCENSKSARYSSSCLSAASRTVCPSICVFPIYLSESNWTDFRENFFLGGDGNFTKICQISPKLVKMEQKCLTLCVKVFVQLYCWQPVEIICSWTIVQWYIHYCVSIASLNTFILLTVKYSSTTIQVINRLVELPR